MSNLLIDQILVSVAVLTAGIVCGTDGFHAVAGKKALSLSKDSSVADAFFCKITPTKKHTKKKS